MVHLTFIFFSPDTLTNSLDVHVFAPTLGLHWDEPENVMNKLMIAAVIAGGLMLLDSPGAAAHTQVHNVYRAPVYTRVNVHRSGHMPAWLHRQKAFRHWYRHSPLQRERRLAWHQLYEIYRWERRWGVAYRQSDNHWRDYYAYRYGKHHHDRGRGPGRRHRH
jgi:competence CoiA-like predicted nuclease